MRVWVKSVINPAANKKCRFLFEISTFLLSGVGSYQKYETGIRNGMGERGAYILRTIEGLIENRQVSAYNEYGNFCTCAAFFEI